MTLATPAAEPRVGTAETVAPDALPAGTRLDEFEIRQVLGVGGFGIVYLARDHALERDVALKEYMPASLAARARGGRITIREGACADTYAVGLRAFVDEARLLARFDHPSLVHVYRFWEDKATAYIVMPYLRGITLREARRSMARAPDEAWIRRIIDPVLDALALLHSAGVFHCDIAPDNILLPASGPAVLLDFGAARHAIGEGSQSSMAVLKPRYAPIEQHEGAGCQRQGPWTDLYALGAVVHQLLFGVPPAPATLRAQQDDVDAIAGRSVDGISPRLLAAVGWALSIHPQERPQSIGAWRAALDGPATVPPCGRRGGRLAVRPDPFAAPAGENR